MEGVYVMAAVSVLTVVRQRLAVKFFREKALEAAEKARSRAAEVELAVEGMMCQKNCATTVKRALENVVGVLEATVSCKDKQAKVLVSPECPVEQLVQAVEDAGFGAKVEGPMPFRTLELKVEGMMCQQNCAATVQRTLAAVPGVVHAEASFANKTARVVVKKGVIGAHLVMALDDIGFRSTLKVTVPKNSRKPMIRDRLRHACERGVVSTKALDETFEHVRQHYHEQPLQEYSRYKNWTQSCYMECDKDWVPKVEITEPLYECMKPHLDKCKQAFAEWYKKLHGLQDVEIITLNSFITKYIPVEGKQDFGKHVDSGKVDGSCILALPTDKPHDWPGITVWDGKDENGNIKEQTYILNPGDCCFLDTLVWHHGLPITKGARYVAVNFYRCKWKKVNVKV